MHTTHSFSSSWVRAVATLAVLVTAGCHKQAAGDRVPVAPVAGAVVFDGKPTPGALVVFHPVLGSQPSTPPAHGTVKDDGTFELTTYTANDGTRQVSTKSRSSGADWSTTTAKRGSDPTCCRAATAKRRPPTSSCEWLKAPTVFRPCKSNAKRGRTVDDHDGRSTWPNIEKRGEHEAFRTQLQIYC